MEDEGLGTPWRPRTRQEEGHRTEKRILKERGARQHPGSGSGSIKQDGSDEDTIYEVKDAGKVFKLDGRQVREAYLDAVAQGKDSVWLIQFSDLDMVVELRPRGM